MRALSRLAFPVCGRLVNPARSWLLVLVVLLTPAHTYAVKPRALVIYGGSETNDAKLREVPILARDKFINAGWHVDFMDKPARADVESALQTKDVTLKALVIAAHGTRPPGGSVGEFRLLNTPPTESQWVLFSEVKDWLDWMKDGQLDYVILIVCYGMESKNDLLDVFHQPSTNGQLKWYNGPAKWSMCKAWVRKTLKPFKVGPPVEFLALGPTDSEPLASLTIECPPDSGTTAAVDCSPDGDCFNVPPEAVPWVEGAFAHIELANQAADSGDTQTEINEIIAARNSFVEAVSLGADVWELLRDTNEMLASDVPTFELLEEYERTEAPLTHPMTILAEYTFDGPNTEGWTSADLSSTVGDFADLYQGSGVLQEDCSADLAALWGFFDYTVPYFCHLPDPMPGQGSVRYGDSGGLYLSNEIWSPQIPFVGSGNSVILRFDAYRDNPLDNLVFYSYRVRSLFSGYPRDWKDSGVTYYGDGRDWVSHSFEIGNLIDDSATDIQIALGVYDLCGTYCGILGSGVCHSQAPMIDNVLVERRTVGGPIMSAHYIDLFQDTFAENGTTTGIARADMARDISNPTSFSTVAGDSIVITVHDLSWPIPTDPYTGTGPSVYAYVSVWPSAQPGKGPTELEAPELRPEVGIRYPYVDTMVDNGITWYKFRMDTVLHGESSERRYCFDLNDAVFTPGDTICYAFGAQNGSGQMTYFSRRLNGQGEFFSTTSLYEALGSPMEFTILPAGGWRRGGDILYVDDADDRSGVQELFDDTFKQLGIAGQVDRFDVLGPSSAAGNGLGSRVTNIEVQLINCYRKIIWNTGDLSASLIGDGGVANGGSGPDKSNDWLVLWYFLDQHPNRPGLYISGDDVVSDWEQLLGTYPTQVHSTYMNFSFAGNHTYIGEPVSPVLASSGGMFTHAPFFLPDSLVAHGGCPRVDDFDVLTPTGSSQVELTNPNSENGYVLSQVTPNSYGDTARVVLSGFSFHHISDYRPQFPQARVEHLHDIIQWLEDPVGAPVAIKGQSLAVNFLDANYPNPFNPMTTIRFGVAKRTNVTLRVYDVAGRLVKTLINEAVDPVPGGHRVEWHGLNENGTSVASGVYFYKLVAGDFQQTKRMVILK